MRRPASRVHVFILMALAIAALPYLVRSVSAEDASVAEGVAISAADLRSLQRVQRGNEARLFGIPGVRGVGIGLSEEGDALALHVYIDIHAAGASLLAVPAEADGVPIRVVETGEIVPRDAGPAHRLQYDTPVPMGVSTSNDNGCYAGTLGVRVFRSGALGKVGYITNSHVASAGGASLCPGRAAFSEDQFQRARFDTNPQCSATGVRKIGDLVQHIPIVFGGLFENTVDAAFVLSSRSAVNKAILDIGNPSPSILAPALNAQVQKSGRTSGLTFGVITSVNNTINVNYGAACGTAKFVNQIGITPGDFSDAGDSGSLILSGTTRDGSGRFRPVGLLFAGSSTTTFANRIGDVLGALSSTIDTN